MTKPAKSPMPKRVSLLAAVLVARANRRLGV